jgi:hypothetical protein
MTETSDVTAGPSNGSFKLPEAPLVQVPMPPSYNPAFYPNTPASIPAMPTGPAYNMGAMNANMPSSNPPPYNAYPSAPYQAPAPQQQQAPPQAQYPYRPATSRPPPTNNTDPRVKDALEVTMFAIAALKVRLLHFTIVSSLQNFTLLCLTDE